MRINKCYASFASDGKNGDGMGITFISGKSRNVHMRSHKKLNSFVVADFCNVKAHRPGLHKDDTKPLCCACCVINLSGTCNLG